MGQHCATNHITDGINARHAGRAIIIDEDETALVHVDAGIRSQQLGSDRATTDSNDQLVEGHLLIAFSAGEVDGHLIALHFRAGQTCPQQDLQALLGKNLERFLGDLLIGSRQELVHGFDDSHFSAQTCPDRA